MLYREYGKTGKKISVIAAGGMRFENSDKHDQAAETLITASELGINYFDTAPGYCGRNSESIVGLALCEIRKSGRDAYVATKSWAPDYDTFMQQLDESLEKIGVDAIDFMHSWGVNSPEAYRERSNNGVFKAMERARDDGRIKHIVCSSHMSGEGIAEMLADGLFEGITLGFCAINFPYRMAGIQAAKRLGVGVVTMNPLGGGEIITHAERFSFIKADPEQSILAAALHFNLSYPQITAALVGFRNPEDVRSAVATLESYQPFSSEQLKKMEEKISSEFDELCTTCNYCRDCPQNIPVAKLMDAYNYLLLDGNPQQVINRLKYHWNINDLEMIENCVKCQLCEQACTQKLPIIHRLEELQKIWRGNQG